MPSNIWLDCLFLELRHNKLLDFLQNENSEIDEEEWDSKNPLINHLDDYYHNKLIDVEDAQEMLEKILKPQKLISIQYL